MSPNNYGRRSIGAHQLSEILINCQNSNMMLISEGAAESNQRFIEKDRKVKKNKTMEKKKATLVLQRSGSEVLVNADALNII
jgi:major membrane immunogen (membrane-anchored lipoprotein)